MIPVDELSPDEARALRNLARREPVSEAEAKRRLDVIASLKQRAFDFEQPPAKPQPRFWVSGQPMFTPGNIGVLQAQAGVGKTSFKAAFIAARICAQSGQEGDTLGVAACGATPGILIDLDTEQSPFDHDAQNRRALRRAGASYPPEWLRSYGLAGLNTKELRDALRALLWQAALDGIYAVIIDGVADLVDDVNDPEECNAFVAELHALAIRYETSIIGILHENPGSENGKGRGHLGSQLTRKSETVLRLVRDGEVTSVFSSKARRSPVTENAGPRFRWSEEAGMHVSVGTAGAARESRHVADLRELAEEVFAGGTFLSYTDARQKVEQARGCHPTTAERKLAAMRKAGVIRAAGAGKYAIAA